MSGCAECRVADGTSRALGLPPLRRRGFLVHPKLEAPPVPGWMIVAPARHVEQIDALDPAEERALGPLLARVGAALRAATPTARLYVCVFAEMLPHLHVHVIARPPDLPSARFGPALFQEPAGSADDGERCAAVARMVYDRLRP